MEAMDVAVVPWYRECLKNHAACMGMHALDGCGEYIPSLEVNPADPSTFKCAACGCHRNFHCRLMMMESSPPPPPRPQPQVAVLPAQPIVASVLHGLPQRGEETPEDLLPAADGDDSESDSEDSEYDDERSVSPPQQQQPPPAQVPAPVAQQPPAARVPAPVAQQPPPAQVPAPVAQQPPPALFPALVAQQPPAFFSSPPHMMLSLNSTAPPRAAQSQQRLPVQVSPATGLPANVGSAPARKRFRTKFTVQQKQRMNELSERLGWRLQKHDQAIVEEWCRDIGVTKRVFKVWMHNNKYSARRSASASSSVATTPTALASAGPFHISPVTGAPPPSRPFIPSVNLNGTAATAPPPPPPSL